jgi:hypothetical protein
MVTCIFWHSTLGYTKLKTNSGSYLHSLSVFSVTRICTRMRDCLTSNFTLRMIRSFKFQFSTGCVTVLTIVSQFGAYTQPDSKMGTEVLGTLTHADAPHQGNAPHSAPHPQCVYNALQ